MKILLKSYIKALNYCVSQKVLFHSLMTRVSWQYPGHTVTVLEKEQCGRVSPEGHPSPPLWGRLSMLPHSSKNVQKEGDTLSLITATWNSNKYSFNRLSRAARQEKKNKVNNCSFC